MSRRALLDEEPFVTIRAHPRRFGWGVPLVFLVSIGAALPLVDRSLSLAITVQLVLQTAGLLWLYVPPARRRWRERARDARLGEREPEEPRDGGE